METILDLNHIEARRYFLQQEHYCNIELPSYFQFQPLLDALSKCECLNEKARNSTTTNCLKDLEKNVSNYILYSNKDSALAWRPLQLINPIAYVYLVSQITRKEAWNHIKSRFHRFCKDKHIECASIPVVANSTQEKGATINNWLNNIEERSMKLSLEYNYMLSTDITNCYGSVYTHSIAWAMHDKKKSKNNRGDLSLIGNVIDRIIQEISYSQTNGIPQGSTLMDFIAEMVLGYVDYQLADELSDKESLLGEYKILRYRDDYRIFTKEKSDALKIATVLSGLLTDINMALNVHKTFLSEDIIHDSLKSDKLPWMNVPQSVTVRKRLLQIHDFAIEFPNSGSLDAALFNILKELNSVNIVSEDIPALISILVDIAFKNPRTYSKVAIALGRLLPILPDRDRLKILPLINEKFDRIPNTEYLYLWLERINLAPGVNNKYDFRCNKNYKLCTYVAKAVKSGINKPPVELWGYKRFDDNAIKAAMEKYSIVNQDAIKTLSEIPDVSEVKVFSRY